MQSVDEFVLGECIPIEDLQGHKHLKARWVDDRRDNGWRCRYVAKEMKHADPHMEGLFTPSSCGDVGRLINIIGIRKKVSSSSATRPTRIGTWPRTSLWHVIRHPRCLRSAGAGASGPTCG